MILCFLAAAVDASVSVLTVFITGRVKQDAVSAHLPSYLHFKSAATGRVHVHLLKMHEQSVQERLSGPRSAAWLKNS